MSIPKALMLFGLIVAGLGLVLNFAPSLKLGRLPGDISFGGEGWRVYLPIGTSILISILLSIALSLAGNWARR